MIAVIVSATSCGAQETSKKNTPPSTSKEAQTEFKTATATDQSSGISWGPVLHAKIKVKDGAGKDVFSIKPKDDGAKLVDGGDQEIARFNLKDEKLKIKDGADHILGYVVGTKGKYQLKDAGQKTILFELQREDDGDWKLKNGQEKLIYRIKKREYGFEIQDTKQATLAKIKSKNGKIEFRDSSDHVHYSTNSATVPPIFMACLGLDEIKDLPLKAGLMIRIALDESSSTKSAGDVKK